MAIIEHLTCKNVSAALRQFNGNMAAAARSFGVTRTAVYLFIERHPELKPVVKECRESMKDHAESSLQRALLAGEAWAVCFYLKCQAKDRGYVERQELSFVPDTDIDAAIRNELAGLASRGQTSFYDETSVDDEPSVHPLNGEAHS